MKPDILYEDEHYVIINKPSGMLSIPDRQQSDTNSAVQWLRNTYPDLYTVHRIDRDTSGVLCFARDVETHRYTSMLFEKRDVKKKYLGIVSGVPDRMEAVLTDPIMEHPVWKGKMMIHQKQGKPSITQYKVLESFGLFSVVEFDIQTGRTHQIRVHMQNIGHPIVCDSLYGKADGIFLSQLKRNFKLSKQEETERPVLNRMALHASFLSFPSASGEVIQVEAPLPKVMQAFVQQCRKWLS